MYLDTRDTRLALLSWKAQWMLSGVFCGLSAVHSAESSRDAKHRANVTPEGATVELTLPYHPVHRPFLHLYFSFLTLYRSVPCNQSPTIFLASFHSQTHLGLPLSSILVFLHVPSSHCSWYKPFCHTGKWDYWDPYIHRPHVPLHNADRQGGKSDFMSMWVVWALCMNVCVHGLRSLEF